MTRDGVLHLILLGPFLGGVALMGLGLGDDYLMTSRVHDMTTTVLGFSILLLSGVVAARISPAEPRDQ